MSPALTRRPRRVLLTTDTVGGVWSHSIALAGGLAADQIEVVLAVLGPSPRAAQRQSAHAIQGLTLIDTGLPLDWTAERAGEIWSASDDLVALAKRERVDLVHLHAPAFAADARFPMPLAVTVHSCIATWWSAVRSGPMPPDFEWRAQMAAQGLNAADLVIAPSSSFAEALCAVYGDAISPIVIHNGSPAPRAAAYKKRRIAFTAGRFWDAGKNIGALDRAVATLDAPVYAAGPMIGPNGAEVRFGSLRPLGLLSAGTLARWYAATPIFASMALYEPFGLAVLEAAQFCAALVLSDIPTFRELWDGAAVFVDPHDHDALEKTLQDLLDAPARAREWAGRAQERAALYSIERMVGATLSAYGSLRTAERRVEAV